VKPPHVVLLTADRMRFECPSAPPFDPFGMAELQRQGAIL
jgi:hypothetical protein